MGKKMKLPFLSKTLSDPKLSPSPWQWPSCGHIKTLSFREASGSAAAQDNIFKTVNSAYLIDMTVAAETPHSCFTNSSAESSGSFSTMSEESGSDQIEMVIRGLRSERLFFEPGESNSILTEANKISISSSTCNRTITSSRRRSKSFGGGNNLVPYKESVVLSMESKDPFVDFRRSMEEMIEAHGLKDWESLEELLAWFLRANGKNNHGYIIGAFVDLLVSLSFATFVSTSSSSTQSAAISTPIAAAAAAATSSTSFSFSPSSPLSLPSSSSLTTPCVSSLDQGGDDDDDNDDENSNILSS